MKIAIMQPYIFPYLGYFQLIFAVDKFVFYDDVNFIKRGWINRNQLLINGQSKLFSIPLKQASQNKLINETYLGIDDKWKKQFFTTLQLNYKKAPYFEEVYELVSEVFNNDVDTISELTINSVKSIIEYLDINVELELSSKSYGETKGLDRAERLIEICKANKSEEYINPAGGAVIYEKQTFKDEGVELHFIENKLPPYEQWGGDFVKGLSIIDVLMFNSKQETIELINAYKLN